MNRKYIVICSFFVAFLYCRYCVTEVLSMQKAGTEKTGASKCSSDKHQAGAAGYKRDKISD